ncbi:MAG TPA: helix-turn-helix transcriptional regulator [Candidatus Entotheonella sp.]|jgi:transcriptional regulator with XRE-family HTH domain
MKVRNRPRLDVQTLAEELLIRRRRLGLTQQALAEASGVSLALIKRIESANAAGIGVNNLLCLCDVLGCSIGDVAKPMKTDVGQELHV